MPFTKFKGITRALVELLVYLMIEGAKCEWAFATAAIGSVQRISG